MKSRREQAKDMAHSLGISFYLSEEGLISQHPPGERIDPPPSVRVPHELDSAMIAKE